MDTGTAGSAGQATSTPPSAAAPTQPSAVATPEGFVEIARLNGALAKIQELTLANRDLTEKVAAAQQNAGSLQGDIAQKVAGWQAMQSEFEAKLQGAEQEKSQLNSQLAAYKAMELKMKIIGEMKKPELYSILGVIPDTTDETALRKSIESLASFATSLTAAREKELLAGITTVENNTQTKAAELPSTNEGWQAYVNNLPLGSPERAAAMDAWHKQLFETK